jgi:hypothetical protein
LSISCAKLLGFRGKSQGPMLPFDRQDSTV